MDQLTKPEIIEGEKRVNLQFSNSEIKFLHEALTNKVRVAKNTNESTIVGMTKLLEEINKLRILMNPS